MKNNEPKFGTWVPEKLLVALWSISTLLFIFLILNICLWQSLAATIILSLLLILFLFYSIYMQLFHYTFSQNGYDLSSKIYDYILQHLDCKDDSSILDIGCGSGAFDIQISKKNPNSNITGLDYWGMKFDYAKEQCENNAKICNVNNVEFIKGDAKKLPFEDETFDAVVSNFTFHEVDTEKNKRNLIYEALRVLKKGGSFSLHDMFANERIYGDINEVIDELKKQGFEKVVYIPRTENESFVPNNIKLMFNHCGLIYGIK